MIRYKKMCAKKACVNANAVFQILASPLPLHVLFTPLSSLSSKNERAK